MCDKHDWWFEYSDDVEHVNREAETSQRLRAFARQGGAYGIIYHAMREHKRSGKGWNNPKKSKPERPK